MALGEQRDTSFQQGDQELLIDTEKTGRGEGIQTWFSDSSPVALQDLSTGKLPRWRFPLRCDGEDGPRNRAWVGTGDTDPRVPLGLFLWSLFVKQSTRAEPITRVSPPCTVGHTSASRSHFPQGNSLGFAIGSGILGCRCTITNH